MSLFDMALTYWQMGYPIPLDLAAKLIAQGYDVEALEKEFLQ